MKILLTERHVSEETPIKLVDAGFEVFSPKEEIPGVHEFDRSALIQTVKNVQPDILLTGFKFQIDEEILSLAPIKAVATRTTGLDHLDLDYCKEKGIEVLSLRGEDLSDITATAEWTFLNMGMLLRKTGHELQGKTLGIIGYGRIGKLLHQYANAFKMRVIAADKGQGLDYLLKESDIVSLHITADEENRNFMDGDKFELMKNGSWFLNSSRDWLVKATSLEWALRKGKLAGAWSDFPEHQGGKTIESLVKTEEFIAEKLVKHLNDKNRS